MPKDLIVIISGRLLQIIVALVAIRILTTILDPKEMGNYYLILSILSFFNLVLLNPPSMYFTRHLLQWQKNNNLLNALFVFLIWILLVTVFALPVIVAVYYWLGYGEKFELNELIAFILAALLISTAHRNLLYGLNTLGHRLSFVFYLVSTLLIGLIISISITALIKTSALSWLMGIVISELLIIYFIYNAFVNSHVLNIQKIKRSLDANRIKHIIAFTTPLALTSFLMWAQHSGYRVLIDYRYSAEVLGYMSVGMAIPAAIFASLEAITMQYMNPIYLKQILSASENQRSKAWNSMAKTVVPIYLFTAFFTIVFSKR